MTLHRFTPEAMANELAAIRLFLCLPDDVSILGHLREVEKNLREECEGADGYLYGDHGKPTYGRPLDYPCGPNDIPGVW